MNPSLNPQPSAQEVLSQSLFSPFLPKEFEDLQDKVQIRMQILNSTKDIIISTCQKYIKLIESYGKSAYSRYDQEITCLAQLSLKTSFNSKDKILLNRIKEKDLKFASLKHMNKIFKVRKFFDQEFLTEFTTRETQQLVQMSQFIEFHNAGFWTGVVTRDQGTLVTAGMDSTLKVWDLKGKRYLFTLTGHLADVRCLALDQTSGVVVSGSYDRTLRYWDLDQRRTVGLLVGHQSAVWTVCFVGLLDVVVSGSKDFEIILWKYSIQTIQARIHLSNSPNSIIFIPQSEQFLISSSTNINIFSKSLSFDSSSVSSHTRPISCLLLIKDSSLLISGSYDNTIRISSLNPLLQTASLLGHASVVWSLSSNPSQTQLVSSSLDLSILIWSLISFSQLKKLQINQDHVYCVIFIEPIIISLSRDSTISFFHLSRDILTNVLKQRTYRAGTANFMDNSNLVFYASGNLGVVWDLALSIETLVLAGHKSFIVSVFVAISGKYAVTGAADREIITWELGGGSKIRRYMCDSAAFALCLSADCLQFCAGCCDGTLVLYDFHSDNKGFEFIGHVKEITSVLMTYNKNIAVSASADMTVVVWDLVMKHVRQRFAGHRETIWRLLISDDEKFVISADVYFGAFVWDLENGKKEDELLRLEDAKKWNRKYESFRGKLKYYLF